ncbi:UV DNA damage repair endonuclease UvsE [Clostridium tetanomorphum]|uniref:UV DNA damage repair endonuclease UvsE n=1 Tax=Clostridium tetanomorphum TaxID=1553 RepID=A0A923EDA8_CLOTT|nr:UV DNA damage repair endonuclease UvsE [Clostridium tetanomorphum]MBC2398463.1 UV DNA damage repair endonuclease UvsE [Clostridium tetanomorphum]NRZ98408.1 UV DNA damage endonuclease [Clostridium tetanomorphum]
MKIGYACIPMTIDATTTRRFILKNFSFDKFYDCVKLNLQDLNTILKYNLDNNIFMFRISSDIIPFGSHSINNLNWTKIFKEDLDNIGNFIKSNNIRVSMHPGQYTPTEDVMKKSIKDIEYHCLFLDSLGVDYSNKIILHIGGAYNDKLSSLKRFKENFKKLSNSAQKRLVLENDERNFNIYDVLDICDILNIPAVFDNLHHKFNPGKSEDIYSILERVCKTWCEYDGSMKLHYSDSDETKKAGAHSKHINIENFLNYYKKVESFNPDIMLEVKDKDISAIECVNSLDFPKPSTKFEQWAKYKYTVMEKDYSLYKACSTLISSEKSMVDFYKLIDKVLLLPYNERNFKNTLLHTWGYVKNKATIKEKNQFMESFNSFENPEKTKNILKKLAQKYNVSYLINSYYFLI